MVISSELAAKIARAIDSRETMKSNYLLALAIVHERLMLVIKNHTNDFDRIAVEIWVETEPRKSPSEPAIYRGVGPVVEIDSMRGGQTWGPLAPALCPLLEGAIITQMQVARELYPLPEDSNAPVAPGGEGRVGALDEDRLKQALFGVIA
jgi:hypothetical protein